MVRVQRARILCTRLLPPACTANLCEREEHRTMASTLAERQKFYAAIVSTALEGGVGYWSAAEEYKWFDPDLGGGSAEPGPEGTANAYAVLVPSDEEAEGAEWPEVDGEQRARVDIDTVKRGVGKIVRGEYQLRSDIESAVKFAYSEWDAAVIDADAADCIVQLGVFGEVVFG